MRATYGRNMDVKKKLDEAGFESFVPMRYVVVMDKRARRIKKFVPVVRDLIFIRPQAAARILKKHLHSDRRREKEDRRNLRRADGELHESDQDSQ